MGSNSEIAIVIVSPDYPPHSGGVERYSWHLAGRFRQRGFAVIVISSSMQGEPELQEDARGVLAWRFPGFWAVPDRLPVPLPSGRWRQLKKRLQNYSSVKFVVQTNLYLLSLQAVRFAERKNYPCLVIVHGSNYVCLGNSLVDKLEHRYEALLIKSQKRHRARFAAISHSGSAFVESFGCKVDAIAYNSIDYEEIDSVPVKTPLLHQQFSLQPETVCFVYLGRLIREKGVLQLAEAFTHLSRESALPLALFVVGDGPLLQELKSKNIQNLYLLGQKEHAEAIAILKQCSCLLLPSDAEGFPTTVLEAAACGVHVITSPYGGCREASELVGGTVMPGNTAEDILAACRSYLAEMQAHAECFSRKQQSLRSVISWENTAETILKALE